MGLSGSGKSTLVRCMSRLVDPTIGKIFFENIDMGKLSKKELIEIRRHKMGMVFQHFALFPHRTVIENIAFPLEVQGIKKKDREKSALEIIELVGLEGREDYFPKELSGGQQQRVGIGRSLAVKPELWFLDEPFSSLDPLIRKEMQNEFLKIQSTLKKTIIFITHDFDEAIKLADRIIIMNEGVIVQIGSPEDLMAFNDEELAEVVFKSVIPIISAIGHETDTTIIDYVSDLRASTPTAAAEKVVPMRIDLERIINNLSQRLSHCVQNDFTKYNYQLINLSKFLKEPNLVITIFKERLKGIVENLCKEIDLDQSTALKFLNFLFNESVKVQSDNKQTHLSVFLKAKALEEEGKKIIHLEVGEPDFQPPKEVKTALEEVYDKGYGKYGPAKGITELRKALASWVSEYESETQYTEENILVCASGY